MGDDVADVFMVGSVPAQLHHSGVEAKVYLPAAEHRPQNGPPLFERMVAMLLCRLCVRIGSVVKKYILPGDFVEVAESPQ